MLGPAAPAIVASPTLNDGDGLLRVGQIHRPHGVGLAAASVRRRGIGDGAGVAARDNQSRRARVRRNEERRRHVVPAVLHVQRVQVAVAADDVGRVAAGLESTAASTAAARPGTPWRAPPGSRRADCRRRQPPILARRPAALRGAPGAAGAAAAGATAAPRRPAVASVRRAPARLADAATRLCATATAAAAATARRRRRERRGPRQRGRQTRRTVSACSTVTGGRLAV